MTYRDECIRVQCIEIDHYITCGVGTGCWTEHVGRLSAICEGNICKTTSKTNNFIPEWCQATRLQQVFYLQKRKNRFKF